MPPEANITGLLLGSSRVTLFPVTCTEYVVDAERGAGNPSVPLVALVVNVTPTP